MKPTKTREPSACTTGLGVRYLHHREARVPTVAQQLTQHRYLLRFPHGVRVCCHDRFGGQELDKSSAAQRVVTRL
eukprot:scaffold86720_cov49-Phaeocystis_antarctica.AAC.2